MTNRVTGLTGLIDIDALVSASLQSYKTKVTNYEKEMKLYELQQNQYREVLTSTRDFYNKYLSTGSSNGLMHSSNYNTINFSSSDEGAVTAKGLAGAEVGNFKVKVKDIASSAKKTIADFKAGDKVTINGTEFTLEGENKSEIAKNLNSQITEYNKKADSADKIDIKASFSNFAGDAHDGTGALVIESNTLGEASEFTIAFNDQESETIKGKDAQVEITNSKGETINYKGADNTVTYDNVQFTFYGSTKTTNESGSEVYNEVTLTGKKDVSALKDKIKSFITDYNKMITDLNTKITEKRYRDYMPLTDDEKSDMSDKDIELWDKKVQSGLLRNDTDLQRIANNMKSAMRTFMSSTGLDLESIGIEPVQNYGTTNGTFTVDDDKLEKALQDNIEGVKELFTADVKDEGSYKTGGILSLLQDTLNTEVMSSSKSSLIKKAGLQGSVTDEMSKKLAEMQETLDDMNDSLTDRENKLYTKYSSLESALSSLQSQQESLTSYLS